MVCRTYDERLRVELIPGFHMEMIEGRFSDAQTTPLLRIRGPMRSLLSAERVMLNFLQRMSGVATQTQRYVRRIAGTGSKIYDTRKTIPGFRLLDKYAVRCGGGHNHRIGLYRWTAGQGQPHRGGAAQGSGELSFAGGRQMPGGGSIAAGRDRGGHARSTQGGAEGRGHRRHPAGQHGLPEDGAGRSAARTCREERAESSWKHRAA